MSYKLNGLKGTAAQGEMNMFHFILNQIQFENSKPLLLCLTSIPQYVLLLQNLRLKVFDPCIGCAARFSSSNHCENILFEDDSKLWNELYRTEKFLSIPPD